MRTPPEIEAKNKEMKALVLQKEKEGKVVFLTLDGFTSVDLESFIQQPTEGILYDLNRDRATVLTLMDENWFNNFAVGLVIKKLKEKIDNQEKEA